MLQKTTLLKIFLTLITIISWFALASQLYLIIDNRTLSVIQTTIMYFSFFTILTNIIVATCCTSILLTNNKFFSKPSTLTAITVYISIVGIVYNIILRFLWQPQGLQRITDELLHLIVPALFILFWFVFVPKNNLKWKSVFYWLIYPIIYVIYIIIRGKITNLYPYPFVDVSKIGYAKALINTAWLLFSFCGISILFIIIGKLGIKSKRND